MSINDRGSSSRAIVSTRATELFSVGDLFFFFQAEDGIRDF